MPHPKENTEISSASKVLVEQGLHGMAEAMPLLFNEAMKIERSQLQSQSCPESTFRPTDPEFDAHPWVYRS